MILVIIMNCFKNHTMILHTIVAKPFQIVLMMLSNIERIRESEEEKKFMNCKKIF